MVTEEKFKEIVKSIKADGLVISRVPKNTREEFIKFAEEEFASDYGMTLKYLWDNYKLWCQFIGNFDLKLDYLIDLVKNSNKGETKVIKTLSGNELKGGIDIK